MKVIHMFGKPTDKDAVVVNTCSSGNRWERGLSPFIIGPCELYEYEGEHLNSLNMENAWQFSKVYEEHVDENGEPTDEYWEWARKGWGDSKAHRYPAGKGRIPEYSLWDGDRLGYIEARKKIYVPLYAEAVLKTDAFRRLKEMYEDGQNLALRDWDGYDHRAKGIDTLSEVLNNPNRKMGHAFVLMMLLTNDKALSECEMR